MNYNSSCSENMSPLQYSEATVLSNAIQNNNNLNKQKDDNLFSQMSQEIRALPINNEHPKTCGKIVPYMNMDTSPEGFNENNDRYASINDIVPKHDVSSRTMACPVNKMNDDFDKYVKEIALSGKFLCEEPSKKATDKQIQQYQDDFFGFNNKINNSSSMGIDVVDKINEGFSGDINSSRFDGMNISDVFKKLTNNDAVNTNCNREMVTDNLIEPQVDNLLKTAFYSDDSAKFYKNYNWRYQNDNVNNGGKFYNDIEASDSDAGHNMIYKPDMEFKKIL